MTLRFESMALVTILFVMGLFVAIWIVGTMELKIRDRFPIALGQITQAIYSSPVTPGNYRLIQNLFKEIEKLPESRNSWNAERLDVLERKFENKFEKLNKAV